MSSGQISPAGESRYAHRKTRLPALTSARSAKTGSTRGLREMFVIEIAANQTTSITRSSSTHVGCISARTWLIT